MAPARPRPVRCPWPASDLSVRYHDEEWGVPLRSTRGLFEFLILEGAQAGLSWETILRKRERYRACFDGFDPEKVARYGPAKVRALLADPGIVRNRLKVEGAVRNARALLALEERGGSFSELVWSFVDGAPIDGRRRTAGQVPATSPRAEAMSRALRGLGFTFVGPTICYAFMQATGMVNDHLLSCFRHGACLAIGRGRTRKG
jgi:DNA-3-methyladenine glycosylase I